MYFAVAVLSYSRQFISPLQPQKTGAASPPPWLCIWPWASLRLVESAPWLAPAHLPLQHLNKITAKNDKIKKIFKGGTTEDARGEKIKEKLHRWSPSSSVDLKAHLWLKHFLTSLCIPPFFNYFWQEPALLFIPAWTLFGYGFMKQFLNLQRQCRKRSLHNFLSTRVFHTLLHTLNCTLF